MNKPEALRRVLLAHVPQLADDPAKLSMFVDKGRVVARGSEGGVVSFETAYALNVVVQDYVGPLDRLFVPVLAWIAEAQPNLLETPGTDPFTFESETLDDDASDISITIELSERTGVTVHDTGGFDCTTMPEPRSLDEFEGVCCRLLRQIVANEDVVAESEHGLYPPD